MAVERVCIIGAGSSGLAALRELHGRGFAVECFEKGTAVGGTWRYDNDSGTSAAYMSLRTNVSRARMQYPTFPMPASYGDYVHHQDMAAYLDAYADAFGLRRRIRFSTSVASVEPQDGGRWRVRLQDGAAVTYDAVVVANGHDWGPSWPELPGTTTARVSHAREYRTPDRFAGRRVLVIGAGQSALEIATETARVAARTVLSCRQAHYVVPRHFLGRPSDNLDTDLMSRLPWPIVRAMFGLMLRAVHGRIEAYDLPPPRHRLLERHPPALSDDFLPALRAGAIVARPMLAALDGDLARFVDGSTEPVDEIVCATGYRISFPFLPSELVASGGRRLALYRRVLSPEHPSLAFVGLVDPLGGLLPIVEAQSGWLADVFEGVIPLPDRARMWAAIERRERRTRRRFDDSPADSIVCDRHAYLRLLRRDRRRARLPWSLLSGVRAAAPRCGWRAPVGHEAG